MFGPILRGSRVTLRPPRKEDLETYLAWFADPEVTRYQPRSTPFSPAQEEAWFTKTGEDPNSVVWAIEVDGKAVGTTGITIGEKSLWRQGLASEAMALRTRYAFRELNLHKLKTQAYIENEGSRRALAKTGYTQAGIQRQEFYKDGRWHDVWEGELLREDWEKAQPA